MDHVVRNEWRAAVLVAHCHGALDLATRDALRHGLPPPTHLAAADAVVVDLTDVTFLDCSALGVLTGLVRDCNATDTRFLIAGARPIVRHLFTALALDQVLVLAPSTEDAVVLAEAWTDLTEGTQTQPQPVHPPIDRPAGPATDP